MSLGRGGPLTMLFERKAITFFFHNHYFYEYQIMIRLTLIIVWFFAYKCLRVLLKFINLIGSRTVAPKEKRSPDNSPWMIVPLDNCPPENCPLTIKFTLKIIAHFLANSPQRIL